MCTKNGSYCEKEKSQGVCGQGRCEQRSEAFVKIKKNIFFYFFLFLFLFIFFLGGGGGGVGSGGGGVRVDVN